MAGNLLLLCAALVPVQSKIENIRSNKQKAPASYVEILPDFD
jgi:hypothetical protein